MNCDTETDDGLIMAWDFNTRTPIKQLVAIRQCYAGCQFNLLKICSGLQRVKGFCSYKCGIKPFWTLFNQ